MNISRVFIQNRSLKQFEERESGKIIGEGRINGNNGGIRVRKKKMQQKLVDFVP